MMKGVMCCLVCCLCVVVVLFSGLVLVEIQCFYVIIMYGEFKYFVGFKYFDYVWLDVFKGGSLSLYVVGGFDNFQLWLFKGQVVVGF